MERFQTIRREIAFLGFIPDHHDYSHYPFTKQHLRTHLICSLDFISVCMFAVHIADSSKEYMDSLYIMTATIAISVSYTTVTFKMAKLFAIFEVFERTIAERK